MKVVLALGSNLGDSKAILTAAISEIEKISPVLTKSTFHLTKPVGGPEQEDFLNAVIILETEMSAQELLHNCQEIENKYGRTREIKWGPRTLDIDIISYGEELIFTDDLTIPHPLAHLRSFVLTPWLEIDTGAFIPGKGKVSELLELIKEE